MEAGVRLVKRRTSRLAQVALVALLIVALAVPGIAFASPKAKEARAKVGAAAATAALGASTGKGQPVANLQKRIDNVLAARAKRFAAAEANISKRLERLDSIATTLESKGASETLIADARAKLDSAQGHLDAALANEVVVADLFKAIASAENRRAAFREAKAAGRESVAELKAARVDAREAGHMLRGIVQSMKPTEDAESSGS